MILADNLSKQILRELSKNSRISSSELARKLNSTPPTIKRRLKKLEEALGIKYVLELNEKKYLLGSSYLIKVKLKKTADEKRIKRLLEEYDVPQYAALVKGDFDLLIYAISSSDSDFSKWANWFRQELCNEIEEWEPLNIIGNWFGFFPIRSSLIKSLEIREPMKKILILLNENSRISLKEIANKTKLPISTAQYYLKKILESGYIIRPTIIITKPNTTINYTSFLKYSFKRGFTKKATAARHFLIKNKPFKLNNELVIAINFAGSYDDFVLATFETIEEYNLFHNKLNEKFGDVLVENSNSIIMKTLVGNIPIRNMDILKTYKVDWNIYEYLDNKK